MGDARIGSYRAEIGEEIASTITAQGGAKSGNKPSHKNYSSSLTVTFGITLIIQMREAASQQRAAASK